ncbi:GTP-binding protein [Bifidobacterium pullorum]|uniref:GTP-binding protein n=1 Tax=Bifidobacterium pullorum TaxID=78448 RepID=UPI003AB3D97D
MTHIVAGILAHVDAGKTTLSEALLYRSGGIRKLGRVDHGDAFLDTESLEKQRGITIHAHQASVRCGDLDLTLLDTPGHVDFAAETERVLRVLDYAILVVSGTDGVQGHTETLWRLLARYQVPTFIFVNKMDAAGADRAVALADLRRRLSDAIYELPAPASAFGPDSGTGIGADACRTDADAAHSVPLIEAAQWRHAEDVENVATLDESAMDEYLETGGITLTRLRTMIAERKLFPVYFGSALKLDGVDEFMTGLETYVREPQWPAEFGARICKISHDAQHNRLTWLKVTGGTLKTKALLTNARDSSVPSGGVPSQPDGGTAPQSVWQEKADQVRVYNGAKFDIATDIPAGGVCAVTGLTRTFPGEGLGIEPNAESPTIQPVLTYTVLPPDTDLDALAERAAAARTAVSAPSEQGDESDDEESKNAESEADSIAPPMPSFDDLTLHKVITALRELEDEDPLLHVVWQERLREVHVQLMGAVQLEIIQQELHDRFGLDVVFGPGGILYRETITAPVEGVGHFEPLRHYAEAHIRLEPGEPGSGVQIVTAVSENVLDRNWQRLIMTHLGEREHLGVLIGAPLTDVKLTLVAGRAHLKHTEGGDFRQATYRAVRQGLMELRAGVSRRPDAAEGQTDAEFVKEAMSGGARSGGRGSSGDGDATTTGHAGRYGYCRVLEPWYRFRLEVPQDMVGRAMSDIQRMAGTFEMGDDAGAGFGSGAAASTGSATDADYAVLTGECPVSEMRDYAMDVNTYTHGRGRLSCTFAGYRPCHDEERVVREAHYDLEADLENTPDSVFCAHGAGYPVKWYKVPEFAHVEYAG